MVQLGDLIGKGDSSVSIKTDDDYMKLCMEITAEWENIVNSGMVLRDENGDRIYLRHDERVIKGVDF